MEIEVVNFGFVGLIYNVYGVVGLIDGLLKLGIYFINYCMVGDVVSVVNMYIGEVVLFVSKEDV